MAAAFEQEAAQTPGWQQHPSKFTAAPSCLFACARWFRSMSKNTGKYQLVMLIC
jgi:hypothetical protein